MPIEKKETTPKTNKILSSALVDAQETLESFGLRVIICVICEQIHPISTGEAVPTVCISCGNVLEPSESEMRQGGES